VRVRYTPKGAAELDHILTYIVERSPQGAAKVQVRIQLIVDVLLHYPFVGKATSNKRLRRIAASPYPYIVYYEVTADELIIHGIRHMSGDPASMT
jgi:plasmid stabilization system protein ParE